jgi:hypothetical protein
MKIKIFLLFLLFTKISFSQINQDITPDNFRSSAHITPINVAEAVIEPFFDPTLNGMKEWKVFDGSAHGLKISQTWANPSINWARRPKDGKVLSMYRDYSLDVSRYDKLIVCAAFPVGCEITITAKTEKGESVYKNKLTGSIKKEHTLDLNSGKKLQRITIDIITPNEGAAMGWFNWIGLQNSRLLDDYLAQWKNIDTTWDGYLRSDKFTPSFKPKYGLIVDSNEIGKLRELHTDFLEKHGTSPFIENIKEIKNIMPEQFINEYVLHDENRFHREREIGKILTNREGHGLDLAVAGILLKDEKLMRLAARYALSIAYCPNWEESFWCDFPGSIWNHRAFNHSAYSFECAMILDLCGDYFTWLGREFIMRRIAEEGLATINWISWKYEYVHHMNQMALFSHGRLAGSVALEKEWPRAKWMTEQGYKDIYENVENVILPDGGYVEGPTYFQAMAGDASLAMYIYSKARNKSLNEVIPGVMLKTKDFASAVISSDENKDVIPICDARPRLDYDMLLVMANALPNSDWGNILNKKLKREGGLPNTILALTLYSSFKDSLSKSKPVVVLPDMGLTASNREYKGEKIKIAFLGNKAFAEHTHEDKGSFILEFAGETFAMDPGTTDYADPLSITLKNCDRHNMLVPYGFDERVKPAIPITADIKPQVTGDDEVYHVKCDLSKGWEDYYQKWIREIDSDSPLDLIIKDTYELKKGDGVEFFWSTQLPVEINGKNVVIKGRRGSVSFTAPNDVQLRLDRLPLAEGAVQNRIVLRKSGLKGNLKVKVKLSLNK